ncbi:ABC transporter permease [Alkalibaculum sp. M08DMB]|uniref:ABC transporter permease n=1 Tax=Alkalibaculum sporogenes TaxID=2655001 RepID=A0A6A7K958_9FIRM|nr:ABC transporter permease [Alkalibaculum sporogenes]MPW25727.1 ABC transporter permease [Alkalibaculum sporogenes]
MQVFKLYIKLFTKALPTIAIYIGVFLAIVVLSTLNNNDTNSTIFEESKVRIAYINRDEESILLQGFKNHLGNSSVFVDIEDTDEGLKDALFFRDATYILIIPEGFTRDFLSGNEPILNKIHLPDFMDATIDLAVNNYFNTARTYLNHIENLSEKEIVEKVTRDLNTKVEVNIYSGKVDQVDSSSTIFYYDYLVYVILSVMILGIGSIMITFSNLDIKRRNLASPISLVNYQFQQILAYLFFAVICLVIFISIGLLLTSQSLFQITSLLLILNVISFTTCALSIAYLVGSLVKSRGSTDMIANVIGLGMSFIGGVFVPIEFLGETVIQVSKFTPAYWYTTANGAIANLTNFTWNNLSSIFSHMLIQLGFTIAIFAVALVINKNKSTEAV